MCHAGWFSKARIANWKKAISGHGDIDVSWSVDRYRQGSIEYGLKLSDIRDVTAHTLPTYEFLRKTASSWSNEADAAQFNRATGLLEEASRRGFISYQILRLEKH